MAKTNDSSTAIMRVSVAITCSSYILSKNLAVLDAGPLLGLLRMRDLVFLTLDGIFKEITGESAGDAYTKALISNREIWEATKFIAYRARITAILNRRCDEDLWACMGLGATTAYLGACTLCIPIMFAGTFVTDHCAKDAKPLKRCADLSKLTVVLGLACFL